MAQESISPRLVHFHQASTRACCSSTGQKIVIETKTYGKFPTKVGCARLVQINYDYVLSKNYDCMR